MVVVLRHNDWLNVSPESWPDDIIVMQHFKARHLLMLAGHNMNSYRNILVYSDAPENRNMDKVLGLPLLAALQQCGYEYVQGEGKGTHLIATIPGRVWGCAVRNVANRLYQTMGLDLEK